MSFWNRLITQILSPQPDPRPASSLHDDECHDPVQSPNPNAKRILVFVSSTFLDMIEERNELTLHIFPKIRKLCEERGIVWGEVDLRWGIPPEKGQEVVLETCLEYIDRCRPFFIGILGERYGWTDWTPPTHPSTKMTWLEKEKGKSVTELEILYGVLHNPAMANHAFFYFRDPTYLSDIPEDRRSVFFDPPTSPESRNLLIDLKKRIRESGFPLREKYRTPKELGNLVLQDFEKVIESIAPPQKENNRESEPEIFALDRETTAHDAFAWSRFGVYVPRQSYFNRLDAYVADTRPPLVITGASGSGKSALLAHWTDRFFGLENKPVMIRHFVGATPGSSDLITMLRRFMSEFKRKLNVRGEIPKDDMAVLSAFPNWLHMAARKARIVLVIDAIDQLDDQNGALDLTWLPPEIPANLRLIVSTRGGRSLDAIIIRGWERFEVTPLTVDERKKLIKCYLGRFHHELSESEKSRIAETDQTKSPLFLRAILEELRIHGEFDKIPEQITTYLKIQDVPALYIAILSRFERDYERDRPGLVRDFCSLLFASRRGLSQNELRDLLGKDREPLPFAYWASLLLAMEHMLVQKGEVMTFTHEYTKEAVKSLYLSDRKDLNAVHIALADYFEQQSPGIRQVEELPWQLAAAGSWDRLIDILSHPVLFSDLYSKREYDLKRYWMQIEQDSSYRMVDVYRPVIQNPTKYPSETLRQLCQLFIDTGHLDEAHTLNESLIQICAKSGDIITEQGSLGQKANILYARGDFDGALRIHQEIEHYARRDGNADYLRASLNGQALILQIRGDSDGAMSRYQELEKICRNLGNLECLQQTLGNRSTILHARGRLHDAIDLQTEVERICREQNNKDGLQKSLGNQGLFLHSLGDLDGALKKMREQESICREIGNLEDLSKSLHNQAVIFRGRGDLEKVKTLAEEEEKITRDLANADGIQASFDTKALLLQAQGDLDGAIQILKRKEQICRDIGNIDGVQTALGNQSKILDELGDFDGALRLLKEQERICRDLDDINSLQRSLGNQAYVLKKRRDFDGALKRLKEREQICREFGFDGSLQESLGEQADILYDRSPPKVVLKLLQKQEEICRKIGNDEHLQACLGSQAGIFFNLGDLQRAERITLEQLRICREIGNTRFLAAACGNRGLILDQRGDHKGAIQLLEEQVRYGREAKDMECLQAALGNLAVPVSVDGDPERALELLKEQEEICRKMENLDGLAQSLLNQAVEYAQQNNRQEASKLIEEAFILARKTQNTRLVSHIKMTRKGLHI